MLDEAAIALDDDTIGITLAERIPIGGLGSLDYGLSASETVADALRFVARFYTVATQRVRMEIAEEPTLWRIGFPRISEVPYSKHWVDLALGVLALRVRQTLGDATIVFSPVAFRHAAPRDRGAHDELFGSRVEFGAPVDRLGIPAEILERRLQTSSKMLAELLERRLEQLAPAEPDDLVDQVRRTLAAMLDDGDVSLDELARRLGTSRRTLQRELTNRQTSHVPLLDELRRCRATELLDLGMSMAEAARRLGYSEPSGLARAYRRWNNR